MEKNNFKKQNNFISEEEQIINWQEIQNSFKNTFGNEVYSSWLEKISLIKEILFQLFNMSIFRINLIL